jgi:hypothetical protein
LVDCLSGLLDEDEPGGHPPVAAPRPEATDATRELARRGFAVGPSSGLNLAGAPAGLRAGAGHHIATVCCDGWSATSRPTCSTTCAPRP